MLEIKLNIKECFSKEWEYQGKSGLGYKAVVDDGTRRGVIVKCTESFYNYYNDRDVTDGIVVLDKYGRLDFISF